MIKKPRGYKCDEKNIPFGFVKKNLFFDKLMTTIFFSDFAIFLGACVADDIIDRL